MRNNQTGAAHGEGVPATTIASALAAAPRPMLQAARPYLFEEERPLPEPMLLRNHPTKVQWLLWEGVVFDGQFVPLKLVSYAIVDKASSN